MRLDTWVHHKWPWIPYGSIQKAIRQGIIRMDDRKVKPCDRLEGYTHVRVKTHWLNLFEQPSPAQALNTTWQQRIDGWVVYEDAHLIAFNKPQGVASQGGSGQQIHMDDLVKSWRPKDTIRLVHRLDIQTSGVLLMAKTLACAQALTRAFHDHKVKKTYWAVVHGHISRDGQVGHALERQGPRMVVSSAPEALSAVTRYRPEAHGFDEKGNPLTFVVLSPRTGRMHQLRVHMEALGHPIWGDPIYCSGWQRNKGGLALHCQHMAFEYKDTAYTIEAPAPDTFFHHGATWGD
jgi:23S rRNA pseudouridine955/2504/2580 synthase